MPSREPEPTSSRTPRVVADELHDAHHPVLGEAELLAIIALGAEHALDVRLVGLERLIGPSSRRRELLGV